MQLHNINAAYALAQTLYGVDPTPIEFEDIALNAWLLIGSKHTRLYRYMTNTQHCMIELPCNVDIIESVHIPLEDAQMTSNKTLYNSVETLFVENYIEAWKQLDNPYYHRGKLVKYKEGANSLYFSKDYNKVVIIYHGIFVDDVGLPLVNDKELNAIAAYVGYSLIYRDSLRMRDRGLLEIAQVMKADWLKYCNAARIPEYVSQNEMDAILDVKVRWDRKQYGKSLKPIL